MLVAWIDLLSDGIVNTISMTRTELQSPVDRHALPGAIHFIQSFASAACL